jgi:hypothetical protein
MTSLDHSAQSSVDEGNEADVELTVGASLLQDDFYRDEAYKSFSSDEEVELNDDPPCDYTQQLCKKSDLKVPQEGQTKVAFQKNS